MAGGGHRGGFIASVGVMDELQDCERIVTS